MIIDEKGRIFGKISIVDILIVAIIIVGSILFFKKLGVDKISENKASSLDNIEIVFSQDEINDFTANSIKTGDKAKESLQDADFGTVTDIKIAESIVWTSDKNGNIKSSSKEGYNSIKITTNSKGKIIDDGVIIDSSKYHVGEVITFKVGNSIFYGKIQEVKKI